MIIIIIIVITIIIIIIIITIITNLDYVKVIMRRCQAFKKLEKYDNALDDAKVVIVIDPDYPNVTNIITTLKALIIKQNEHKISMETQDKLKGLKLLKERRVQFDLILTFNDREQQFIDPFITPDDINEDDWIRKLFFFYLNEDEVRSLVKISSCQHYTDNIKHLDFLHANGGKYYFNSDENDDLATAYWDDFRHAYLDSYKGQFIFLYTAEEFKRTTGYDNMRDFMIKTGTDHHHFYHL